MSVNAERWLIESMTSHGGKTAIIWKGAEVSYDELVDNVRCWSEELAKLRITAGDAVAMCGDYSPSVCALMISLIANRNIVIPLTLASGTRRSDFLRIAQAKALPFRRRSLHGIRSARYWGGAQTFDDLAPDVRAGPDLVQFWIHRS
jgi:hypothetical protein